MRHTDKTDIFTNSKLILAMAMHESSFPQWTDIPPYPEWFPKRSLECTIFRNISTRIGPTDLTKASIVLFHDGILITNNIKEFERIPGLKTETRAE